MVAALDQPPFINVPLLRIALTPRTWGIFALALGAWCTLVVIAGLLLWNARQGYIEEVKLRGGQTVALLQAHTAITFEAVEGALAEIVKTLERDRFVRHDENLRTDMRTRLTFMPYVRALYVIGPDGYIQHDTDFPGTPDVSLADRAYFQQYLSGETSPDPISAPLSSRSGWGSFVAVTQPIGKGPSFQGVAVAAIQLNYFSDLYEKVEAGAGSEILLFHRNGTLLTQFPGLAGSVGQSYVDFPLIKQHLHRASSGAYLTFGDPLPYPRVVNYAALPTKPLVVAFTQDVSTRMEAWERLVTITGAVMVLLLAATIYAIAQYTKALHYRKRQEERRAQGEKMEALGLLTGSIAHDFANVLNVAATNINLIQRLGHSDAHLTAAATRAKRALDNGSALTRQLMTFARKREIQLENCDVNAAITSMLELLEHAAGPACTLVFDAGKLPFGCRLDRSQFEAALINLVVNARQAIERDGRITVRTRSVKGLDLHLPVHLHDKRFVCVSVVDNGKGMSEEVRRRAIEPFFTTKGEEGTGFGLAQVYAFMQQIGGELTIESLVGFGTTVHLCAPESIHAPASSRTTTNTGNSGT